MPPLPCSLPDDSPFEHSQQFWHIRSTFSFALLMVSYLISLLGDPLLDGKDFVSPQFLTQRGPQHSKGPC